HVEARDRGGRIGGGSRLDARGAVGRAGLGCVDGRLCGGGGGPRFRRVDGGRRSRGRGRSFVTRLDCRVAPQHGSREGQGEGRAHARICREPASPFITGVTARVIDDPVDGRPRVLV